MRERSAASAAPFRFICIHADAGRAMRQRDASYSEESNERNRSFNRSAFPREIDRHDGVTMPSDKNKITRPIFEERNRRKIV